MWKTRESHEITTRERVVLPTDPEEVMWASLMFAVVVSTVVLLVKLI